MTHLAQKKHTKVSCFCTKWVKSKNRHNQFWVLGMKYGIFLYKHIVM